MANNRQPHEPRERTLATPGHASAAHHVLQRSTVAGAAAGTMTSILCSPFDVLKTRHQVEGLHAAQTGAPPRRMSVAASVTLVYRSEGARGFYHGLTPALVTVPVFWGCYFPIYEHAKRVAASGTLRGQSLWVQHVAAAVAAGACSDALTNPLWVIRTRLQTNALRTGGAAVPVQSSMINEARLILRNEGLTGFFKGLPATFLGLSHVAIQFPLYEEIKRILRNASRDNTIGTAELIVASTASKAVASVVTYPHEVVRSRLQYDRSVKGMTLVGAFRAIVAESGVRGLYAGLRINMIRVVPACVTTFVSYEWLMNSLTIG